MLKSMDTVEERVNINDILNLYKAGIKPEMDVKVGLELERLSISSLDYKMVEYDNHQ